MRRNMALEMQEISLEYSAKLEKEKIELKKEKMGRKISKKIGRKMDRNEPEDRCWDTIDHKKKCMVSRFGRWTKCSTTCGLGVTFRFRDFTHLEPNCISTFYPISFVFFHIYHTRACSKFRPTDPESYFLIC
jgi:hypothetical protein